MTDDRQIAVSFLRAIWSRQPNHKRPHLFLARKDFETGNWSDLPIKYRETEDHETLFPLKLTDYYFCPNLFKADRRLRVNALPGRWLYADLDEVDPETLPDELQPTLEWETSPGRWQAMWLLTRPLRPRALERLNQAMTYATGADKGGWSLTKVLRFPGTTSTKHADSPDFLVHYRQRKPPGERPAPYDPADLTQLLAKVPAARGALGDAGNLPAEQDLPSYQAVYRRTRKRMKPETRQLLNTKTAVRGDDRSIKLWELERRLLADGVKPEDVFVLVRTSVWNKYRGQQRERTALWNEIQKATANPLEELKSPPPSKPPRAERESRKLPQPTTMFDFMTQSLPQADWLVEGIWSGKAHGVLAGEPKSYKSLITLDLAVSVATGTPFLNHFRIPEKGPVLIIQEENNPSLVLDRMHRIMASRGFRNHDSSVLDFSIFNHPIEFLHNEGFTLTEPADLRYLVEQIQRMKPALVVLDPFYLMARGVDENSASEMIPILDNILRIKQRYDTGILIVHHFHKPKEGDKRRMAHRISGSGVFHRWLESAMFVEVGKEPGQVIISGEHRGHGNGPSHLVQFTMSEEDELEYRVDVISRNQDHEDDEDTVRADKVLKQVTATADLDELPDTFWIKDHFRDFGFRRQREMATHLTNLGGWTIRTSKTTNDLKAYRKG